MPAATMPIPNNREHTLVHTISGLTSNASTVALTESFIGYFLKQMEIKTTTDVDVTVTIKNANGTTMAGGTATTAATGGEFVTISAPRYVSSALNYTLAGLTGGEADFTMVFTVAP